MNSLEIQQEVSMKEKRGKTIAGGRKKFVARANDQPFSIERKAVSHIYFRQTWKIFEVHTEKNFRVITTRTRNDLVLKYIAFVGIYKLSA